MRWDIVELSVLRIGTSIHCNVELCATKPFCFFRCSITPGAGDDIVHDPILILQVGIQQPMPSEHIKHDRGKLSRSSALGEEDFVSGGYMQLFSYQGLAMGNICTEFF